MAVLAILGLALGLQVITAGVVRRLIRVKQVKEALAARIEPMQAVHTIAEKSTRGLDFATLPHLSVQRTADLEERIALSERTNAMLRNEIAERQCMEEERERLITELEARSAEMERFTYTVSHDLKSPLLTIQGFLGLLEKDAMAGNIAQMQTDITYIRTAASTMQRLLNELLELSRIGRVVNPLREVALSDLAQEAVTLVSGQITARGVQVHIAPDLPVVIGDRPRLLEVLQNLLDNAVKFMGSQPQPCINFGVRRDAEETVCYVRDNGIGIAPRYHQKVFGLFERLDGASDGTGIGLTLVKRIIEVHGGRIWVESVGEGHGSTFCFTVPCPSPGAPEKLTPSA